MIICMLDAGQFIEKPEFLEPLKQYGEIRIFSGMPKSVDEVVARAGDAEVVAFAVTQLTHEMIDRLPKLKILQFIGTGMWNFVDVDYAVSKGIEVLNIDAYGSNAVAEFAVSLAMSMNRNIVPAVNILKAVIGEVTLDSYEKKVAADINGDGWVRADDAVELLKYVIGID